MSLPLIWNPKTPLAKHGSLKPTSPNLAWKPWSNPSHQIHRLPTGQWAKPSTPPILRSKHCCVNARGSELKWLSENNGCPYCDFNVLSFTTLITSLGLQQEERERTKIVEISALSIQWCNWQHTARSANQISQSRGLTLRILFLLSWLPWPPGYETTTSRSISVKICWLDQPE